jgi:hypothetical protein
VLSSSTKPEEDSIIDYARPSSFLNIYNASVLNVQKKPIKCSHVCSFNQTQNPKFHRVFSQSNFSRSEALDLCPKSQRIYVPLQVNRVIDGSFVRKTSFKEIFPKRSFNGKYNTMIPSKHLVASTPSNDERFSFISLFKNKTNIAPGCDNLKTAQNITNTAFVAQGHDKYRPNESRSLPSFFYNPSSTLCKTPYEGLLKNKLNHNFNVHYLLSVLTSTGISYPDTITILTYRGYFKIHGSRMNLIPHGFYDFPSIVIQIDGINIKVLRDRDILSRLRLPTAHSGKLFNFLSPVNSEDVTETIKEGRETVQVATKLLHKVEQILPQITQLLTQLGLTNGSFKSCVDNINTVASKVGDSFDDINNCTKDPFSTVKNFFEAALNGLVHATISYPVLKYVFGILIVAIVGKLGGTLIELFLSAASIVLGWEMNITDKIRGLFSKANDEDPVFVAQGPAPGFLWSAAGLLLFGAMNVPFSPVDFAKLNHYGVQFRTVTNVVQFLSTCFTPLINYFCEHVLGLAPTDGLNALDTAAVVAAIKYYNEKGCVDFDIINMSGQEKIVFCERTFEHYRALQYVLERITVRGGNVCRLVSPSLTSWVTKYQTLINKFSTLGVSTSTIVSRQPYVLYILGEPRIGKTSVVNTLVKIAMKSTARVPTSTDIYSRDSSDYWEGYGGQFCTLFDDFGAMVDSVGNPNRNYLDLLLLGSDLMKPLPMAVAESKGRTFFTSPLVILTGNEKRSPTSLTNKNALVDRISLEVTLLFLEPEEDDAVYFKVVDGMQKVVTPRPKCPHEIYDKYARFVIKHKQPALSVVDGSKVLESKVGDLLTCYEFFQFFRATFLGHCLNVSVKSTRDAYIEDKFSDLFDEYKVAQGMKDEDDDLDETESVTEYYDAIDYGNDTSSCGGSTTWDHILLKYRRCKEDAVTLFNTVAELPGYLAGESTDLLCTLGVLDPKWHFIANVMTSLVAVGALFATMYTTYLSTSALVRFFSKESDTIPVAESYQDKEHKEHRSGKGKRGNQYSHRARAAWMNRSVTDSEADDDIDRYGQGYEPTGTYTDEDVSYEVLENYSRILKQISKNTFYILLPSIKKEGEIKNCSAVFVSDTHMLLLKHTWVQICRAGKFKLVNVPAGIPSSSRIEWRLTSNCVSHEVKTMDGNSTDLMMVKVPSINMKLDIIQHFPTEEDWPGFARHNSDLILPLVRTELTYSGSNNTYVDVQYACNPKFSEKTLDYLNNTEMIRVHKHIEYMAFTASGDCGTPIVTMEKQPRIIGMHSFGSAAPDQLSWCGGIFITQDMIRKTFLEFKAVCQGDIEGVKFVGDAYVKDVDLEVIGVAPGMYLNRQSVIVKSILYNKISTHLPSTKPAILTPVLREGVVVDPLLLSLKKMEGPHVEIDIPLMKRCADLYFERNFRTFDWVKGPLPIFESCFPDPGLFPYTSSINRGTSSGFLHSGSNGKKNLIGTRDKWFIDPGVESRMNDFVMKAKRGVIATFPFVISLKDERRPIAKVEALKTRTFSIGMIEFVILFRQYFLPILNFIRARRIYNGIAVGMNPYSTEWDAIAEKFSKFVGDCVVAGDFSGYDGSLQQSVIQIIGEKIINSFNDGEDNKKVRLALWHNITHSVHLIKSCIIAFTRGNPSGCPITTELNSIYTILATIYAYGLVMESVNTFYDDVDILAYGDDSLSAINPQGAFRLDDLVSGYKALGLTFTGTEKDKPPVLAHISQCSFLRRSFQFDRALHRWKCPLDLVVIQDMINWSRDNKSATFIQVMSCALFEQGLHSRKSYEEFAAALRKELQAPNRKHYLEKMPFPTYDLFVDDYFSRADFDPGACDQLTYH